MDLVVIVGGIFATTVGYQVARAVSRSVEQRATMLPDRGEIMRRLEELQQTVDSIAVEVERVAEAQRFSAKLLAERPVSASVAPVPPIAPSR